MKLKDFGFHEGINEVVGVTFGESDRRNAVNTAPLGVIVKDPEGINARVRVYPSHTRENIKKGSILYANIVWDPVVFALAAFQDLSDEFFRNGKPPVLDGAVAICEFKTKLAGSFAELKLISGKIYEDLVVPRAVNRGFNAVIEGLVHATRFLAVKDENLRKELRERIFYYRDIVERCGSQKEKRAYNIILGKLAELSDTSLQGSDQRKM